MQKIQVFSNENFGSVRVLEEGEPLFCAIDICRALGYANGRDTLERLFGGSVAKCYAGVKVGEKQDGSPIFQEREMSFLTEPQVYKLIMRSNAKNAEPFQDWVCGEVLPSIRKSGGYSLKHKIPQTYAEALLEAGRLALENEKLIAKAKEDAPKVQCFNELMDSKNAIDFMTFSKVIGIGRTTLFQRCRDLGILMQDNNPFQRFIDNGYFRVIEATYTQGDTRKSYTKTMILPRGQDYLSKKLKAPQ